MDLNSIKLKNFSAPLKVLCTCYILFFLLGYALVFVQIYSKTQFSPEQTKTYYRGIDSEEMEEFHLPKSFDSMLNVTHVHTLSQPMLFFILGLIFAFSEGRNKRKCLLITLPFAGSLLSNASPWLVHYVCAQFVYLMPVAETLVLLSTGFMSITSLRQLFKRV